MFYRLGRSSKRGLKAAGVVGKRRVLDGENH